MGEGNLKKTSKHKAWQIAAAEQQEDRTTNPSASMIHFRKTHLQAGES